jgi:sugar/nucleoside kinase (ribokinase family)
VKRLGVLGTMIWDTIMGREPAEAPVEEWGGISYALAGLDASLAPGWQVVPLVKVGRDLAGRAQAFLRDLLCVAGDGRFIEVPEPNPRVTLTYLRDDRRCEGLTGPVPTWTWSELGPMVMGLDALYVNFITGYECDLATAQALRQAFPGPIYGDLHSLALGRRADGTRQLRPVEEPLAWLACFDVAQLNEDEMAQMGDEPLALAVQALERGVRAVCVTLGAGGAVYGAEGDFTTVAWAGRVEGGQRPARPVGAQRVVRTALVKAEAGTLRGDPTGCGDVFGATLVSMLLAGAGLEAAVEAANRMARRNVTYRGATGLQHHLRGGLTGATTS